MCVCLFACLFACLVVCLLACLVVGLFVCLLVCLSVCLFVWVCVGGYLLPQQSKETKGSNPPVLRVSSGDSVTGSTLGTRALFRPTGVHEGAMLESCRALIVRVGFGVY